MLSNHLRKKSASAIQAFKSKPVVPFAFKNYNKRFTAFRPTMNLLKPMSAQADNFVNGTSAVYVDMLYDQWKEDPNSVHSSW